MGGRGAQEIQLHQIGHIWKNVANKNEMSQETVSIMNIFTDLGNRAAPKSLPYRHNTESFTSATAMIY